MSQAINDRLDQIEATIESEKTEVAAALQALRDEVAQGRLNEAQIAQRLDGLKQKVTDMHSSDTPPQPGGDVEPPTGVV